MDRGAWQATVCGVVKCCLVTKQQQQLLSNGNKYTILIETVNNRGNWVSGIGSSLLFLAIFFVSLKLFLNKT